jgi:excisionase family DNA binding protein
MELVAFYRVDETAKILRLNRTLIYDRIAAGQIPAVRLGRAIRVPGAWVRQVAGWPEPVKPVEAML